ncbi:hypothetical protein HRW07_17070, partial [Streptomyces lunaelactis]|nr:hypothetical protein [Streptomyces lunaelactis]
HGSARFRLRRREGVGEQEAADPPREQPVELHDDLSAHGQAAEALPQDRPLTVVTASPSSSTAAAAMRAFCGTCRVVRAASVVSNPALSTG